MTGLFGRQGSGWSGSYVVCSIQKRIVGKITKNRQEKRSLATTKNSPQDPIEKRISANHVGAKKGEDSQMQNGIRKTLTNNPDKVANFLGWFSIGLGLVELTAPRTLARAIGVKGNPLLLRLFGLREIASGIAILSQNEKESG